MKTVFAIFLGLAGGFVLGIALSSFIGTVGLFLFGEPFGIKFLPYYTAFLCAVIGPVINSRKS